MVHQRRQRKKSMGCQSKQSLNDTAAAALTIDYTTGILKITSGRNTVLNISNQLAVNPTARIEDSGNLVLTNGTEKQSLWQSFDNPTNTLLPGMKLGFNTPTGQNWNLTSWITDYVPASGAFTLSWEPTQDSGQLVVYRRGERYRTSGLLKDQTFKYMSHFNDQSTLYHCSFSVVSNNDEKYLTFSGINGGLWMWELTPKGNIQEGANSRIFGPYDFCYEYELVIPGKNVDMDSHCSGNISSYAHCGYLLLSKNQKAKIRRRREEEANTLLTRVDDFG
ncbi:hypothetical protein RHGRI_020490 [Rhododendron griersonianum]|nr:hypothetical protein RHGRI_020490 [Rhododendron griersonianum]